MRYVLLAALCLGELALGAPSSKAKSTDPATLFEAAQKAYKLGKFADALALFQQVYELRPHPSIRFNQAKCEEQLGDVQAALRFYRTYLFDVPDTVDREAVTKSMIVLERKLSRLNVQQLMVVVDPRDAVITVDGKRLGPSPAFVELGPGDHHLVLEREGLETVSRSFMMSTQKSMDLTFTMQPPPPPPPVLTPPPSTNTAAQPIAATVVTPAAAPSPAPRVAPMLLTGAGGVLLIAGGIVSALAGVWWGQLHDPTWTTTHTLAQQKSLSSSYSLTILLGPILGGVGAATGLTFALWWLLGAAPAQAAPTAWSPSSSSDFARTFAAP
jgi:hypothetical protein